MAPTRTSEADKKAADKDQETQPETTEETPSNDHERLDEIVSNLGYSAQDEAIREVVEYLREKHAGKRPEPEENEG